MSQCTDPSHLLDSISLTHVQFDPNDKIAYAFGYITLAPIAILVFYASVIVSRREMAGIFMLAGQLLNEALNYVLKEAIEQERPHSKWILTILNERKANLVERSSW
jgi:dolichyldiphosphatase